VLNNVSAASSDRENPGFLDCALELHRHPSAGAREAASEFRKVTGLGAQALVGTGANLASLVFYHRVYLAARQSPDFDATHRAEIVRAAQQVRERFEQTLNGQTPGEWRPSSQLEDAQGAPTGTCQASLAAAPANPPPKGQ
jgi:hypothetical protein